VRTLDFLLRQLPTYEKYFSSKRLSGFKINIANQNGKVCVVGFEVGVKIIFTII
jgi:hypothetical protein